MDKTCKDIEKMSDVERMEFMNRVIPHLEDFPKKRGYEGCVYFLNDELIIKKYDTKKNFNVLECVFDAYCDEYKRFSELGYKIPRIFAWIKIPLNVITSGRTYDYYILEQCVPGKSMFIGKVKDIYDFFSEQYSEEFFDIILSSPNEHYFEFKNVVKRYIQTYVEMNQIIESMSVQEIQRFIDTVYQLHVNGKYNIPDVHAKNVIFAKDSLFLIDNYMCERKSLVYVNKLTSFEFLVSRIIMLFRQNSFVSKFARDPQYGFIEEFEYRKLIEENMDLCVSSLKKMIAAIKVSCNATQDLSQSDYDRAYKHLIMHLDSQRATEVVNALKSQTNSFYI